MNIDNEPEEQGTESPVPVRLPPPFSHVRFAFLNVLLLFATYHLAGALLVLATGRLGVSDAEVWMQGAAHVLFLLVPALFLMRYSPLGLRGLLRTAGGVTPMQWVLGLAGVITILVFNYGWVSVQEWLIPRQWMEAYHGFQEKIDRMYETLLVGRSIGGVFFAFLVGAVIPAFSEEVLFRGLMQRSLEEEWSPPAAILAAGLVFGFVHLVPTSIVPLVLIGVYLGFLAWYTRSLALPILVHFFNNAISITALNITGYDPTARTESILPLWEASLVAIAGLAGLLLIVWGILATPRFLRRSAADEPA